MTTMAEYEEAVANGDTICQCGYRKSQHGTKHPAKDPRTGQCNNSRFVPLYIRVTEGDGRA